MKLIVNFLATFLLFVCVSVNAQKGGKFHDDISSYRIVYEQSVVDTLLEATVVDTIQPRNQVNKVLDNYSDSLATVYKERGVNLKGYRIQVYNGNDRENAEAIYGLLRKMYPDECVYKPFTVNFKVKIGNFRDRIEAHTLLSDLKKRYRRALMISDNIEIDCLHR